MRANQFLHILEEIRLGHVERIKVGSAYSFEINIPIEGGTQPGQFLVADLVIQLLRIAATGRVERPLGQAGFNLHDDLRLGRGFGFIVAQQHKHFRDVLDVFLAQVNRLGVVLEIVVAIGQAQAALIHFGNHLARVLEVGVGVEAEQYIGALAMQPHDLARQPFLRLDGRDALEIVLQRLRTGLLDGPFIHAAGVVIADLLFVEAAARTVDRRLLENVAHNILAALRKFVEAPPGGTVGGNRILRHPLAARVGIKVVAGVDALIEHVDRETQIGRLRGIGFVFVLGTQRRHKQSRNDQHLEEIAHENLESKMWNRPVDEPCYWTNYESNC